MPQGIENLELEGKEKITLTLERDQIRQMIMLMKKQRDNLKLIQPTDKGREYVEKADSRITVLMARLTEVL